MSDTIVNIKKAVLELPYPKACSNCLLAVDIAVYGMQCAGYFFCNKLSGDRRSIVEFLENGTKPKWCPVKLKKTESE